MNLETRLDTRLWEAVRTSFESRNYTAAILDAIHFLSDIIRERAGVEGDGVALIGTAFGGNSPKLKVNRLQTESEQNVQRGVEALLRGLYQAIRNPRSHGAHQDDERDAVAILLFVDYLLRVVDHSRSPFSLSTFVARVLDPDFVPNQRYAELLVGEIPPGKRLATCREVFAKRGTADPTKIRCFYETVLATMSPTDTGELYELVSEELRHTDDNDTVRFVIAALPSSWPKFDEVARLRIENKLIKSIREGAWDEYKGRCLSGALGTWATNIIGCFTLKDELMDAIATRLKSGDQAERDYAFKYFTNHLDANWDKPSIKLIWAVKEGLKSGDVKFRDLADYWTYSDQGKREPTDPWRAPFIEALAEFTEAAAPFEDVPF